MPLNFQIISSFLAPVWWGEAGAGNNVKMLPVQITASYGTQPSGTRFITISGFSLPTINILISHLTNILVIVSNKFNSSFSFLEPTRIDNHKSAKLTSC